MVRLYKWQLSTGGGLGLHEVALPRYLIVFVFLIEDVPRVYIIFDDDFSPAVLQKFLPGSRNVL
jgi:hypothetical protein